MNSKILVYPKDKQTLWKVSENVTSPQEWKDILDILFRVIQENPHALGVSAIQVGIPKRVFLAKIGGGLMVFVNPIILQTAGDWMLGEEGCLSIPEETCKIYRWGTIIIKARNIKGFNSPPKPLHNLEARIVQHEIDHLNGVLMTDKEGIKE